MPRNRTNTRRTAPAGHDAEAPAPLPTHSPTSRIPVGTRFSSSLIDLGAIVDAIISAWGDRDTLTRSINSAPVWKGPSPNSSRRTRSLPLEAAVQYGLVQGDGCLPTDLTRTLSTLPPGDQIREFARHILLSCGGLRVVQGIREMLADGISITGDSLARHLSAQGFFIAEHNTAINTLRMWLAEAGVFARSGRGPAAWHPNETAIDSLIGFGIDAIARLSDLNDLQKAYALALARHNPSLDQWVPAATVRDAAEAISGINTPRGSLPLAILQPLQEEGLIEFRTGGTQSGKPSELRITKQFEAHVLRPFFEVTCKSLNPVVSDYFRRRPADIRTALDSDNRNVAGAGLEAFAIQVMRTLGLSFDSWRSRAVETGFGEVDVLLSGVIGCVPTRWQLQCKNTHDTVSHEVIAREIGLLGHTRATHILIITRGSYSQHAIAFAHKCVHTTVPVFLIDGPRFTRILENPSLLASELRGQARYLAETCRPTRP